MWLGESLRRTYVARSDCLFHYYSCARMRITIGMICVVNTVLWYFQVGHRSELSFAYEQNVLFYIQGVTGGTDQTSGECYLGHTIPI